MQMPCTTLYLLLFLTLTKGNKITEQINTTNRYADGDFKLIVRHIINARNADADSHVIVLMLSFYNLFDLSK